jgi:hypothetical protein
MGIKRRTRIWTTVGTAALIGGLAGCSQPAGETPAEEAAQARSEAVQEPASGTGSAATSAPAGFAEGEGEGEGGGGGGEFGIDPVAAETDPVVYHIALEVMRAHYLAGIDAFRAGDRTAGAEMFAHPIGEIYIDFEPVLENLGAPLFGETMTEASVAPFSGAGEEEVANRVDDVLAAIDAAAEYAPPSELSAGAVHARVLADLVERGALQYRFLASNPDAAGDAYLDGYGFARGARRYAANHMDEILAASPEAAARFASVMGELEAAFPTARRPAVPSADADALIASVSELQDTVQAAD